MSTTEPETENSVETITGSEILVEMLIRQQAEVIFAYPGGCSMPLHQALRAQRDRIRTILPRHEQGGTFAAQGVARTTGRAGVCMATSGPGATNLVTGIADAKLDSIPMVAITGQVPQKFIGDRCVSGNADGGGLSGDHQTSLPDHRYQRRGTDRERGFLYRGNRAAGTGIDRLPQRCSARPPWRWTKLILILPFVCRDIIPRFAKPAPEQISQVVAAIRRSKRPVLYVGGGCILSDASEELREFALRTGIPVTMTVMGLGAFPGDHETVTAHAGYAWYGVR